VSAASETVQVTINGEMRAVPAAKSIAHVLAWLELPDDRVAVEMNKAIVRKRDWSTVLVAAGAQLEIVEFVGGG